MSACRDFETKAKGLKLAIGVRGHVREVGGGYSFDLEIYIPGAEKQVRTVYPEKLEPIKDRAIAEEVMVRERDRLVELIRTLFPMDKVTKIGGYKSLTGGV